MDDESIKAVMESKEWFNLATTALAAEGAVAMIEGKPHSKAVCLAKCLNLNQDFPEAWKALGLAMKEDETFEIGSEKKKYTRRDMFLEFAKTNSSDGEVWNNLGIRVKEGEVLQIGDKKYTDRDLYILAVENSPKLWYTWFNLATDSLKSNEEIVKIKEQGEFDKVLCYAKVLELQPKLVDAWKHMATSMKDDGKTVTVSGKAYSRCQCFVEVVKLNADDGESWNNVAIRTPHGGSVTVGSKSYTDKELYVVATEKSPKLFYTWFNLANDTMTTNSEKVKISGKEYTKKDCYVMALTLNPKFAEAWKQLGMVMTNEDKVMITMKGYNKRDAFVECVRLNPEDGFAWNGVAICVNTDEIITIDKKDYNDQQLYIIAAEKSPELWYPWYNVANDTMKADEKIRIGGKDVSRVDCFIKTVELNAGYSEGWKSLAFAMQPEDSAVVNGTSMTRNEIAHRVMAMETAEDKAKKEAAEAAAATETAAAAETKKEEPAPAAAAPQVVEDDGPPPLEVADDVM